MLEAWRRSGGATTLGLPDLPRWSTELVSSYVVHMAFAPVSVPGLVHLRPGSSRAFVPSLGFSLKLTLFTPRAFGFENRGKETTRS